MRISVDISYYPLQDKFIPPIRDFIDRLNTYKNLTIHTNGISSQVYGEYDEVMNTLQIEMKKSFELPHSIFVLKILGSDRSDY